MTTIYYKGAKFTWSDTHEGMYCAPLNLLLRKYREDDYIAYRFESNGMLGAVRSGAASYQEVAADAVDYVVEELIRRRDMLEDEIAYTLKYVGE